MSSNLVREVLSYDALQEAETVTGKSYKNDEGTAALGLFLHVEHAEKKAAILRSMGDSLLSNTVEDYQRILEATGLEKALEMPFAGRVYESEEPPEEKFFVYACRRRGLVLYFDTFRGDSVNSSTLHYCWVRPGDYPLKTSSYYLYTSSGTFRSLGGSGKGCFDVETPTPEDQVYWEGYHDGREAIRYKIASLENNGVFLPVWPEHSRGKKKSGMYLTNYMDRQRPTTCPEHTRDYIGSLFKQRFDMLPEWVQDIIGE